MREILFRAKKISNNEWVHGYLINNIYGASKPVIITDSDYDDNNKVNFDYDFVYTNTIGQYTGLKDKNGVKIFEGDIVIAPFLVPKMTLKLVANMEWNNRWWSFADKLNNYCEIIGNIYDNPELLEQGESK